MHLSSVQNRAMIYENINDYNPIRKIKKLIVFDDMIADIVIIKQFQTIIISD